MQRRFFLLSGTAMALCACVAPGGAADAPDAPVTPAEPMEAAEAGFDVALYRAVAAAPGNQFVSPFSVASAFALLYPGARGGTAHEIAEVFGFDADPAAQSARTHALSQTLQADTGGSEFTLANAAWVERTMQLRAAYAAMIRDDLGATIEAVDFIRNQAEALRRINAWAARETRDRIPEILSEPAPDRRLVLTNAIYFKGKWSAPFDAAATRDGEFHPASGAAVPAQLMNQVTRVRYAEEEGVQAAEFDYDDGAFALAVFLPRARDGLAAFESSLTDARLTQWLERLAAAGRPRLDVTLPKLEMRTSYDLSPHLQALGVRAAFTPAADLSGISEQASLMVSAVIHKTFLAIDEEGAEAAAVTAVDVRVTSAMPTPEPPPIEFKADRPFFIVLRHKPTGARLFLGRVATTQV